jgi:hypothetical protein
MAQSIFRQKSLNDYRGKRHTRIGDTFSMFKVTAPSKQLPNGQKIVQSGHPSWTLRKKESSGCLSWRAENLFSGSEAEKKFLFRSKKFSFSIFLKLPFVPSPLSNC